MRSLRENITGVVDLGVILMIGVAFAGLMVGAYIIFKLKSQLTPAVTSPGWKPIENITDGFDDAVALVLVAVTIFILAIAISALLMLRGR